MASNINPNNIDTAYPIAGQDNDSQGFRDNFTNIKSNFSFTQDEINDLQNNVLIKNTLQGGVDADIHNNLDGTKLIAAKMQDTREVVISDSTGEIDVSRGSYYTLTIDNNQVTTLNFTRFPPGDFSKVRVDFTVNALPATTAKVNLPTGTIGYTQLNYKDTNGGDVLQLPAGRFIYEFFSVVEGEIIVTPILEAETP